MGKRILRPVAGAVLATAVMLGLGACDPTPESSPAEPIVIAGGGTTGVYYQYGKHLAEVLSHDLDEQFVVAETAGSIDNLLRIGAGEAMLGFAQSDAAASAVEGSGTFERVVPLRAIARLYDEYVHVVVRRDSDIEDLTDLVGRKVSLGAKNSGVNLVAMRVLEAARVDAGAVSNAGLGPDASIEALRSGQIDAFFWVGGVPTRASRNCLPTPRSGCCQSRLRPSSSSTASTAAPTESQSFRSAPTDGRRRRSQ